MTSKQVVALLKKHGWVEKKQKGSHKQMEHVVFKKKITIPMHNGDLPIGTLKSILKQANLKI